MLPTIEIRAALLATLTAIALAITPGTSLAATDEERGAELLGAIESGEKGCDDLDRDDYTAIGEFAMGRMLSSDRAHEAMDRMMAAMMGERGLDRMHEVMGMRFGGCGSPRMPAGFGGMMGMMGMMGGGTGPGGMMGGGSGMGGMMGGGFGPGDGGRGSDDRGYGPGNMMGFNRAGADDDDDDDAAAWVALAVLLLAAAAVAGGFLFNRNRGRTAAGSGPLDQLAQRFANGEISGDEYSERRHLLEGRS